MPPRYEGKVTLITGGARGIGKGCVLEFVKEGALVVFCDIKDDLAKETEAEANSLGPGKCSFVRCDIRNEKEIQNLIDTVLERHGQLDCIVNVAGWHPPLLPIDKFSADDFRDLLNLNLVSLFCTAKYGLPHLRKTKGNIINISSMGAIMGQKGGCTYIATKGGVTSFTRSLAIDEGPNGVRINCISPGSIHTPLVDEVLEVLESPAVFDVFNNYSHLGRMGTMSEIGKACVYLSADATFCTGTDLHVSGGAEFGFNDRRDTLNTF